MRNVTLERIMAAPRSSVWAVLADYPNRRLERGHQGQLRHRRCNRGRRNPATMRPTILGPLLDLPTSPETVDLAVPGE